MTRRALLGSTTAAVIGGMAVGGGSAGAQVPRPACAPALGPVTVRSHDSRYRDLTTRAYNGRFTGRPELAYVIGSPEQLPRVIEDAVAAGRQIAVRSGGHCFENFVDDPAVGTLIDISEMKSVYFDPEKRAFAVEAGATLGQVYRTLYFGWGVTIPAGACPGVGVGGHVAGGGYGELSHQHGLVVDHLYAVEVVVVDANGKARRVVATRDPGDPNRELWWAHTGGGGGNFGIVTRYWFRSPEATGDDPATLLPKPPETLRKCTLTWQWTDLTEAGFATLVRNYGTWQANNTNARYASLHSGLTLYHRAIGTVTLDAQMSEEQPDVERLMGDYVAAISKGVGAQPTTEQSVTPWLTATLSADMGLGRYRFKAKSAYLRKPWSDVQVAAAYQHLTDDGKDRYGSFVHLGTFGGKINQVGSTATAMAHRDSIINSYYETSWGDPDQDEVQLAWVRGIYGAVHADTGGVPVPNASNDGAHMNYADSDLADPNWNTSGVPWHTLYYKGNYARLQRVKARWDPRNVFRHTMSVELPR